MGKMLKNIEKGKKSGMQTSQNKFHSVIASVLMLGLVLREQFGLVFFKIHDLLGREYSFQRPLLRSYFGVLEEVLKEITTLLLSAAQAPLTRSSWSYSSTGSSPTDPNRYFFENTSFQVFFWKDF